MKQKQNESKKQDCSVVAAEGWEVGKRITDVFADGARV